MEIPAKIRVPAAGERDVYTRDVCSGGAFFRTEAPLPIGTEMEIALVLPLDKLKKLPAGSRKVMITLTGKVLRTDPEGMGVCFREDYEIRPWPENHTMQ